MLKLYIHECAGGCSFRSEFESHGLTFHERSDIFEQVRNCHAQATTMMREFNVSHALLFAKSRHLPETGFSNACVTPDTMVSAIVALEGVELELIEAWDLSMAPDYAQITAWLKDIPYLRKEIDNFEPPQPYHMINYRLSMREREKLQDHSIGRTETTSV